MLGLGKSLKDVIFDFKVNTQVDMGNLHINKVNNKEWVVYL